MKLAVYTIGMVVFIINLRITLIYRPYGTAYFNFLAGKSEYVNRSFDVEFWGNVYRQAGRYVEKTYGSNKTYYTAGLGAHILQNNGFKGKMTDDKDSDFDYAMFMNKQSWLRNNNYVLWLLENKRPIYTIEREGKILFYLFLPYQEEYQKIVVS